MKREIANTQLLEEMMPLFAAHYSEVPAYSDIPFQPSFEQILMLETAGILRVFTARHKETDFLIGYAVYFLQPHFHFRTSLQASADCVYIRPEYRGNGLPGLSLMKFCDDELEREGAQVVFHNLPAERNFGPMMKRLGYKLEDHVYSRRLNG